MTFRQETLETHMIPSVGGVARSDGGLAALGWVRCLFQTHPRA